jgi:hypothetical protein
LRSRYIRQLDGQRNNAIYEEALRLWGEQFNLQGSMAFESTAVAQLVLTRLLGINAVRCRPPLPEAEVRTAYRSAMQFAAEEAGAAAKGGNVSFPQWTCAELMGLNLEVCWLVDYLIAQLMPCIIAGPKKAPKTSLLIDLALSLAMGGLFLGRVRVSEAARTGLMTGESGLPIVQETIRRVCDAAGYDASGISSLIITDRVPQLHKPEHVEATRRFVMGNELAVLMIDPVYLAMAEADHANLFDMGARLRVISEVCQESGATLLLCHHARKTLANPFEPMELGDIGWAAFGEFARQ